MINFTKDELSTFSLQQLADLYAEGPQETELQQEMFEHRAAHSDYFQLTAVDIKAQWQEKIIQKYVDVKREHMALENPIELTPEEQALLEPGIVTKEAEIALQKKLDERTAKRKGVKAKAEVKAEAVQEAVEIPIEEKKEKKSTKK